MSTLTVPDNLFHEIAEFARTSGKPVDVQAAELLTRALASEAREMQLMKEIRADKEVVRAFPDNAIHLEDFAKR